MKQGWEIKKLGEVCSFERGLTYSKSAEVVFSANAVLRSNNVNLNSNSLNFDEIKYINDNVIIPSSKKVKFGSILICTANGSKSHLGKVALIDTKDDYAFGGFMGQITPNNLLVLPSYLFYGLITPKYKEFIGALSDGANINNLKFSDLKEFPLNIPSELSEQERIVGMLDSAFAKIEALQANAQQNLQNAKDLFKASLKQELISKQGWKTQKLDAIADITSSKRIYKDEYVKNGVPFYRTKEIKELANGQNISLGLFISTERYQEIKNKFGIPQIGDILISAVGTIGEILVIQDESEFYFKDGNIIWIKSISKITSSFLSYNLKSIIEQLKSITIGTAYSALTIEKFKEMKISFPDSKIEQQAIVEKLDALSERCRAMEENYRQTIAHCNALKQALLTKAFSVEL